MAQTSPHHVVMRDEQRRELERRAAAYFGPFHHVVRSKAIPLAAGGLSNMEIAERLEQIAQPLEWKFTRKDPNRLQERLERPTPQLQLAA